MRQPRTSRRSATSRNGRHPRSRRTAGTVPDDGYILTLKELIDHKSRAGKRNNVVVGSRKPERDKALLLFMTLRRRALRRHAEC